MTVGLALPLSIALQHAILKSLASIPACDNCFFSLAFALQHAVSSLSPTEVALALEAQHPLHFCPVIYQRLK